MKEEALKSVKRTCYDTVLHILEDQCVVWIGVVIEVSLSYTVFLESNFINDFILLALEAMIADILL